MGGRERGPNEALVPERNVESSAPSRNVQPLVAVADKEIRVQPPKVDVKHADPLRTVHQRQYIGLLARGGQGFGREPHAGERRDEVKDADLGPLALLLGRLDSRPESIQYLFVLQGVGDIDATGAHSAVAALDDIVHSLGTSAVDGAEVEDLVLAVIVPLHIVEDGAHANAGVADKYHGVERYVEHVRNGCSGLVELFR